VLIALPLFSSCAVGKPKPATFITDISATLNADIYSNFPGTTTYSFNYGTTTSYGIKTTSRTLEINDTAPRPISEPIQGLQPSTTYHWMVCARDEEENPPRVNCSQDQTFTTGPAGGRSGIAFSTRRDGNSEIYVMDPDGANPTRLTNSTYGDSSPTWSPDGRKIAWSSSLPGAEGIYTMNPDASAKTRIPNSPQGSDLQWSPDGTRIAFLSGWDIYVVNVNGTGLRQLTTNTGVDNAPAWSPDGTRIAFRSLRNGGHGLYVMNADGSDQTQLTSYDDSSPSWTPTGRSMVFTSGRVDVGQELWTMDFTGQNQQPLGGTRIGGIDPSYSPDGRTIAFWTLSDSTGSQQIRAINSDGTNPRYLTNSTRQSYNQAPAWSPRLEP
jgi:Tol biopolymer transport system component